MSQISRIKVVVSPLSHGMRRIELRCSCVRVSKVAAADESVRDVVDELKVDHVQVAPLCQHLSPVVTVATGRERRS